MAIAWSSFTSRVLLECPRCSQPLAEQAVRDAVIELCEESQIYVRDLPVIDVAADTASYDITSDVTGTEISMVKAAWLDDVALDYASLDVLNGFPQDWQSYTAEMPTAFTHMDTTSITLVPTPTLSSTGGLRVQVTLRPTQTSSDIVDWIGNKYFEAITNGAKGKLLAMPETPWGNAERALWYQKLFHSAKTAARIAANKSLTRAAPVARPRPAA